MPEPTCPITARIGPITTTLGAMVVFLIARRSPNTLLARHVAGDWGELDDEDWQANNEATKNGGRILSSYSVGGEKVWIITDVEVSPGRRYATTILLPSEY